MRIVCRQTILMKYHTLIFSKIRKDVAKYVAKDVANDGSKSICRQILDGLIQFKTLQTFCVITKNLWG